MLEEDGSDKYLNYRLIQKDLLLGKQMGSSFGYTMLVTDINKDGLDDLLVSAPQFYQRTKEGKYGGAVYIYVRKAGIPITETQPQILYGELGSSFGQTLADLGDFDQDSFNDVAIAAPLGGEGGEVYIYRGGADGVLKLSQKLDGRKFKSDSEEFGISISGNIDLDQNGYPDLLIGSKSDFAVQLRSRPIVTLTSTFSTLPEKVDLKSPECQKNNGACFEMIICFTYGTRHNEYESNFVVRYKLHLDTEVETPRVVTASGDSVISGDVTLARANEEFCLTDSPKVQFKNTARDRFTPVKFLLEYEPASYANEVTIERPGSPLTEMIDVPVMDEDFPSPRELVMLLSNDCKDPQVCESDLKVEGTVPKEINIGKSELKR